jgi:S-(hydroxymethyl)glutathione dehydrogenase/alcohol dehydrogenase
MREGYMARDAGKAGMSRRLVLGAAAAGAAAPAVAAPAVRRGAAAGLNTRAFIRTHEEGVAIRDVRLTELEPDEVLVRTKATQAKYTLLTQVLTPLPKDQPPTAIGHTVIGVVEAVGAQVQRARVGDRVCVTSTPQCGQCEQCLMGRVEFCQWLGLPGRKMGELADGTTVMSGGFGISGGHSEYSKVQETSVVPVFTDLSDVELCLLSDTVGVGLVSPMILPPFHPGQDVVVMGCGPIGLAAVMGARLCGAADIVAIEPIRYRRELAAKYGATRLVDPNVEGDGLTETIRDMFRGRTDHPYQGGRLLPFNAVHNGLRDRGPDLTISTVGGDRATPKVEIGPDPTGIKPLRQAWEYTRSGGHVVYLGVALQGDVSLPANNFANHRSTVHAGQMGGMHPMRDLPRLIKLVEKGRIEVKSLATHLCRIEGTRDAFQRVADRTTVAAVVEYN